MDILLRELGKVKALLPVLQLEGIRKKPCLVSAYPLHPSSLRVF